MENKNTSSKGKVALVTGSATGIGYETAVHLGENGFRTYASMRNLQKANGLIEIAKNKNPPLKVNST
jgi:NAD(P)-dependent dehydrogenase (short-subunit alcohol dehydrogenase family)